MSTPKVGDRINNYLLEELVGSGSFGQVWRARHHVFDEVVAIKVPTDPQYVRNLQREGVAIHGLKHPNIVRALDLDPYGDPPYLIMEYVDGPSLREVIDANSQGLPVPASMRIMRGLLAALDVAHAGGLVHRDVKPANILLNHPLDKIEEVTSEAVKVTDFGLGRVGGTTTASIMQSGSMLTEAGKSISGTLAYMSPEQKAGNDADPRSDLYACGIILFELLTGERPSGVEAPSALRSDVPQLLDEVFRHSYTRLERRYASARQMLDALTPGSTYPEQSPAPRVVAGGQCPKCHTPGQEENQYCIHCGHRLVAVVPRCPSCHAYVNRRDHFCIFCGTKLQSGPI